MFGRVTVIALATLVFCGCRSTLTMRDGKYTTTTTYEWIQVESNTIRFCVDPERMKAVFVKEFNYELRTDGTIIPYVMTSAEAFHGLGRFDWHYEDERILKKNWKSGEVLAVFSLDPSCPSL